MDENLSRIAVALFSLTLAGPVAGLEFSVTRTDDPEPDGCLTEDCSLREAIIAANDTEGEDEILLSSALYRLFRGGDDDAAALGDLDITDDLVVSGVGMSETTIDGNGQDRVFDIDPGQVGVTVEFIDLTIRSGSVAGRGGGIRNQGTATLTRVGVIGNFAEDGSGGIENINNANLSIVDSVVAENFTPRNAAGIRNSNSTLTIMDSAILDNEVLPGGNDGGGVYTVGDPSTVSIINTTIAGNRSDSNGGGIHASGALLITIVDSEIRNNSATNNGGAIRNFGTTLMITRSTISDNQADQDGGGLFLLNNETEVTDSTISGNRAARDGGGVYARSGAVVELIHTTIAGNEADSDEDGEGDGGGIANDDTETTVRIANTIVANNSDPTSDPDCFGFVEAQGVNLVETVSDNCALTGNVQSVLSASPLLSILDDNGGPTSTHALQTGSPAIDGADNAFCGNVDQRGAPRAEDGDGDGSEVCDLGAFEAPAEAPAPEEPPVQPPIQVSEICGNMGALGAMSLWLGLASLRLTSRRTTD